MITGQIEPCIRRKRKVYLIINGRVFFFRVTAFSIFFDFSFAWFAGLHCVLPL